MKFFFCFLLIFASYIAVGQIPKPQKHTYINDYALILNNNAKKALNQKIAKIEKKYNVQLAVVLVNKIPADYDIKDFSLLIGRKWHVGNNKRGLVYVAAIQQHQQRIEVARNLDSVFTSANCATILDAIKEPFRNRDYSGGLQVLVSRIDESLASLGNRSTVTPQPAQEAIVAKTRISENKENDTLYLIVGLMLVLGIPALVIFVYIRDKRKRAQQILFQKQMMMNQPNQDYNPNYSGPYNNGPGYYPSQGRQPSDNSGLRNFAAGALIGGAAGYAARAIQDRMSENNSYSPDNISDNSNDNNNIGDSPDWGNWGSGDDGLNDSSGDSGFSDSGDNRNDDSGATSDW